MVNCLPYVSLSVGQTVRKRVSVCFVDFIFQEKKELKSPFHKKKQDKTTIFLEKE